MNAEELFLEAIQLAGQSEGETFIESAEASDDAKNEAIQLLRAHYAPDRFLNGPVASDVTQEMTRITECEGMQIGPYKLLQQIGEGGFGIVFMAERTGEIQHKVALKIVKPGMDTREVIARFEAERRALSMMEHPNIASVIDAGTTEHGRPYFVMELVRGLPITEYCDKYKLKTAQRLELFVQLCLAIQHAHQRGVIHRDIKPSNVLVTNIDGKSLPKVIDFGVAKALNQRLTEKTLFTRFGNMIGTPQYMSPEQAEFSAIDVDTRSDVYSLGVLLYELLTGTTPIEKERLLEAAYDELRRIIREEEPVRPSIRLSTVGDDDRAAASRQETNAIALRQYVKGDLDWIVLKALAKDRARRYESPRDFATDVTRFLETKPVVARKPSVIDYSFKFLRRNSAFLRFAAAAILIAAISTGAVLALQGRDAAMPPEELLTYVSAGEQAFAQNDYAKTEQNNALVESALLEQLPESAPQLGKVSSQLAYSRAMLGKHDEAFEALQRTIDEMERHKVEGDRIQQLFSMLERTAMASCVLACVMQDHRAQEKVFERYSVINGRHRNLFNALQEINQGRPLEAQRLLADYDGWLDFHGLAELIAVKVLLEQNLREQAATMLMLSRKTIERKASWMEHRQGSDIHLLFKTIKSLDESIATAASGLQPISISENDLTAIASHLGEIESLFPQYWQAPHLLAQIEYLEGRPAEAVSQYLEAARLGSPKAIQYAAVLALRLNDIESYREAHQIAETATVVPGESPHVFTTILLDKNATISESKQQQIRRHSQLHRAGGRHRFDLCFALEAYRAGDFSRSTKTFTHGGVSGDLHSVFALANYKLENETRARAHFDDAIKAYCLRLKMVHEFQISPWHDFCDTELSRLLLDEAAGVLGIKNVDELCSVDSAASVNE